MLTAFLFTIAGAAMDDPTAQPTEWTHTVTVRDAAGKFNPLTRKAVTRKNEKTGETLWEFQLSIMDQFNKKGSTVTVEEGDGKGDVWAITRVTTGGKIVAVERQAKKD